MSLVDAPNAAQQIQCVAMPYDDSNIHLDNWPIENVCFFNDAKIKTMVAPPQLIYVKRKRGQEHKRKVGLVIGYLNKQGEPMLGWSLCRRGDTFDKDRAMQIAIIHSLPVLQVVSDLTWRLYPASLRRHVREICRNTLARWAYRFLPN